MSLERLLEDHRRWMKVALKEAERAYRSKEVPVGAVVVFRDQVVGRGSNMVEKLNDPTAHAEMIAITAACETLGRKHLEGCTLYVTLEPCAMCAGAIVLSRIDKLVFAAQDEKTGAAASLYNIPQDRRLNHYVEIVQGVEESHSAEILEAFFRDLRSKRKE
jgi:tRNA(adenine34) deaminase